MNSVFQARCHPLKPPGPSADVTLFRQQQQQFSDDQTFAGDKAYQGAPRTRTPHKKPKGGALSEAQVEANRIFAGERIVMGACHLLRRKMRMKKTCF
jgi:hypothetical protein